MIAIKGPAAGEEVASATAWLSLFLAPWRLAVSRARPRQDAPANEREARAEASTRGRSRVDSLIEGLRFICVCVFCHLRLGDNTAEQQQRAAVLRRRGGGSVHQRFTVNHVENPWPLN